MTRQQRLAEAKKRAVVLQNKFREILYRNVCMSLFERHKLLFAFFISLKVYEPDKSFEAALKQLDNKKQTKTITDSRGDNSKIDISSKFSDAKSNSHAREKQSLGAPSQSLSRITRARKSHHRTGQSKVEKSDRMTQIDEEREF